MYGLSPVATSSKVLEYQEKLGFFQPSTVWRPPAALRSSASADRDFKMPKNPGTMWSDPKKLDNNSKQKLFKRPKGLAVCELQAASPSALPWFCGCCSSPDSRSVLAWSVPWIQNPADIEVKGDNKIDDAVVKAKQAAAEEMAVASGVKYLMYAGSRITSSHILDDIPITF